MGRRIRNVLSILIACLLFANIMPAVTAYDDSLTIFLFLEEKTYFFNDTVNLTVHVFDKGDYLEIIDHTAPPDTVSLSVNGVANIPLTKHSRGVYKATYKLNISDGSVKFGDWHFNFVANTTKDLNKESSDIEIVISEVGPDAPELSVRIDVSDGKDRTPKPGDSVKLTITVKQDGSNMDPDDLTLSTAEGPLAATRTSEGVYQATYVVSSSIDEDTMVSIQALATHQGDSALSYADLFVDFYNVWMKDPVVGETHATFEIWVADLEGNAVPGALVGINSPAGKQNTTDKNGKAFFSISYSQPEEGLVTIRGEVTFSAKTQGFTMSFLVGEITTELQPREGKFDIFPLTYVRVVDPGDVLRFEYVAYNDTELWADKTIYYYAVFVNSTFSTDGFIVDYGSVTTASNGRFNVTFTAPDMKGDIHIYFESATKPSISSNDNLYYSETVDPFISVSEASGGQVIASGLSVNLGELVLGGKVDVTVRMSGSSGYIGRATWELEDENWTWISGQFFSYLTESGNRFTGDMFMPEFLPLDKNYVVEASLIDPETGRTYFNYAEGVPTKVAPPDDEDQEEEVLSPFTLVLIIIVVVIIVGILAAASKGGKAGGAEKGMGETDGETDGETKEEAPEEKAKEAPEQE